MGTIEAKAFRKFMTVYSLLKSKRLRADIKLSLHKALVGSTVTYVRRDCEFVADTQIMESQSLQSEVLQITTFYPSSTAMCNLRATSIIGTCMII
jgi:hypothetical protein